MISHQLILLKKSFSQDVHRNSSFFLPPWFLFKWQESEYDWYKNVSFHSFLTKECIIFLFHKFIIVYTMINKDQFFQIKAWSLSLNIDHWSLKEKTAASLKCFSFKLWSNFPKNALVEKKRIPVLILLLTRAGLWPGLCLNCFRGRCLSNSRQQWLLTPSQGLHDDS